MHVALMSRGSVVEQRALRSEVELLDALEAGLLKILSKMGISLLASYHGKPTPWRADLRGDHLINNNNNN